MLKKNYIEISLTFRTSSKEFVPTPNSHEDTFFQCLPLKEFTERIQIVDES